MVWLVLGAAAVLFHRITLLPLLAGLAVPLLAAPLIAVRRAVRVASGVTVYLRAAPAMVTLGSDCRLSVVAAATDDGAPPFGLESPDRRWVRVSELRAPETGGVTADETSWATPRESGRLAPSRTALVGVAGLAPHTAGSTLRPVPTGSRGIFGLPRLRLWTHDPFVLFGVAGPSLTPLIIVVYPPPAPGWASEPATADTGGGDQAVSARTVRAPAAHDPGELAGLRPYRRGDRLHQTHWPSFAGSGPILVREFAPDRDEVVRILLDDRAGRHRRGAFDDALGVTHGIILDACSTGRTVELRTLSGGRAVVAPTDEGIAGVFPLLATLTPHRPLSGDAQPAPIPRWGDTAPPGPCMVVTTTTALSSLPHGVAALGAVVVV